MEETAEPQTPFLSDMNLATTPQQFFESADDMLLQASAVRKEAEELQRRSQMMYKKVYHLQEAAFNLQRLGMQDREYSTKTLDRLLLKHKHVLPHVERNEPGILDKLVLAVEEGTARLEEVEGFDDKLQALVDKDIQSTAAESIHKDKDDSDSEASQSEGDRDAAEQLKKENEAKAEALPEYKFVKIADLSPDIDPAEFEPTSDNDDEHDRSDAHSAKNTDQIPKVSKPTPRKCKRVSELEHDDSDIEDAPMSKRRKRRLGKKARKLEMLHRQGFEESEIAALNLDEVGTPPRKKKVGKSVKKIKNKK